MVVSLVQLTMKCILMGVVVATIRPKYGILLSWSCIAKIGGTLQMDYSYSTVLVFGGEIRRLYREAQMACLVIDHHNPSNQPIYVIQESIYSFFLHFDESFLASV